MNMLSNTKKYLKWKLYYQYQSLKDTDEAGTYSFFQKIIMFLNLTYVHSFGKYWTIDKMHDNIIYDTGKISDIIYKTLIDNKPCMIARYGLVELNVVSNYIFIKRKRKNIRNCITGKDLYFWWNKQMKKELSYNAGFFPNNLDMLNHYCDLMIEDTRYLDVLETWIGLEPIILSDTKVSMVGLQESEPWWQTKPWTRALKGKKIVVVHPFAELIESQYKNREHLFKNKDVLPDFELRTVKAVQSIGGLCNDFNNWFDALKWMESEIAKEDFDVVLIGCGAYGFPLAAYVKKLGKKAVHMGGVLQMLFGIKGARWEDKNYHPKYDYTSLFNEYWIKPDIKFKPSVANNIENGCYW